MYFGDLRVWKSISLINTTKELKSKGLSLFIALFWDLNRFSVLQELPFCLLNLQSPREITRITINAENDAISGTDKFFFFFFLFSLHDSGVQRPGLSSILKEIKSD
jgi:hypothetical protein